MQKVQTRPNFPTQGPVKRSETHFTKGPNSGQDNTDQIL